jgi:hypothetical protein
VAVAWAVATADDVTGAAVVPMVGTAVAEGADVVDVQPAATANRTTSAAIPRRKRYGFMDSCI